MEKIDNGMEEIKRGALTEEDIERIRTEGHAAGKSEEEIEEEIEDAQEKIAEASKKRLLEKSEQFIEETERGIEENLNNEEKE